MKRYIFFMHGTNRRTKKTIIFLPIMRKYIRLTLFAIAFICCILMIVYRQKYAKLNLVFQLMNSFGIKDASTKCNNLHDIAKISKSDWNTIESSAGLPVWTEVFPGIYLYATYWLSQASRTLAFVENVPLTSIEKLQCKLWYNNIKEPISGEIKIQLFQKKQESVFLLIECKPPSDTQNLPHSVSFVHFNESSFISLQILKEKFYAGSFSMCVEPLPVGFSDLHRVIEFLVYHHRLGVNHFVFYDKGISPSIKKIFLEMAPKTNIFVTLLPWNVPFRLEASSEPRKEYLVDCLHRVMSRNYSQFILNSDINQFIVPKDAQNLTSLIKSENFPPIHSNLYELRFCSQYVDDIFAHNLNIPFVTLLKTKLLKTVNSSFTAIYRVSQLQKILNSNTFKMLLLKGFAQKSAVLPKQVAVVHTYKICNVSTDVLESDFISEKYMWKYKDLFFKSRLYNLVKQQGMISD